MHTLRKHLSVHCCVVVLGGVIATASCATPHTRKGLTPLPGAVAVPDASLCGPEIANLDAVRGAPMILLGEFHGLTGNPAFAIDLACRLAIGGQPVLLALEIPEPEQERIDTFLASPGAPADRVALLAGDFWQERYQDGRSSEARLEMLDRARRLHTQGVKLRVVAIDRKRSSQGQAERDQSMAAATLAARRPGETTLLLIGNLHIHTVPGAPWSPGLRWTGVYLRERVPTLIALDNRYGPGQAWSCSGNEAETCGVHPVKGRAEANATGFGITRLAERDANGLDGTYAIGPAVASKPAVPPK